MRRPAFRYGFFLLAGLVILFLRCPGMFENPQFWAEDSYFFERQYTIGFPAFIRPYNGYLHFLPRLIAAVASTLDPRWIPLGYVAASLTITLYTASRTLSSRFPFKHNGLYFMAILLVPDAGEVLLNPTNLQSITVAVLVMVLISRPPESLNQGLHDLVAVFVCGLTGPHILALLPLFAWRTISRKTAYDRWLLAVAGLVGSVQGYYILTHPGPVVMGKEASFHFAVPVIGERMAGSLFFGGQLAAGGSVTVSAFLAVLTMSAMAWLGLRRGGNREARAILILSAALLILAGLVRLRYELPDAMLSGYGARYFFFPQLVLIWLLADLAKGEPRGAGRWALLALVFAFGANFSRLREPSLPNLHWEDYAAQIRNHQPVVIPVNPLGWKITLNKGVPKTSRIDK